MFEDVVLRKMFGPKTNEATGEWRRLNNELYDLCSSSRAGHVERMGRGEMHTQFWWESMRERTTWQNLVVDERILKMDLQEVEWEGMHRTVLG